MCSCADANCRMSTFVELNWAILVLIRFINSFLSSWGVREVILLIFFFFFSKFYCFVLWLYLLSISCLRK